MLKHTKKLFSLFLLTSIVMFIGCQEEPSVITPQPGQNTLQKETSFTLPTGATIVSATLKLYQFIGNNQQNNIHRIISPWTELGVTWNNFAGAYDPAIFGLFIPAPSWDDDTLSIDITTLVQGWADCSYNNYGLLIDQLSTDPSFERSIFYSKENTNPTLGEHAPYLQIILSTNDTIEVIAIADAYINSHPPNDFTNYGSSPLLNTGYLDGYEKQALIRFDIQCTPNGGCTLTPGYWKTHSEFGPAPYDDTWAQLSNGASTTFFLSNKTYYQVLWTSPRGNAYYNLSFHYIATQLNFLNGADPSAAQEAYDAATILFNNYTPAQIAALKGNNPTRQQFISLAGILGNYNEGIIGPGHCD
ncbi:MAG: hypothetical protein A2W30_04335 [Ignavibacteria bacterium RBG_16_36_9]|nr:MAG: hypothetical protein A2W30_04335 [Ignavibacteria bacterium RBG_16_36_9]